MASGQWSALFGTFPAGAARALCRTLTFSAIPLSFLHPGALAPRHMLAPKRRQTIRRRNVIQGDSLMSPAELHADSIVIDGLIIAKWNRELFEDMRKGGLTAANCTVSVWEGFQATINSIVASQKLIRENSDLVLPVRTTADIRKAKEQGKTGILFGFQNAHAFEDQLGYVEIFKQLGVGIVQMCYNTQNLVGTGCYERDGGLSGFGREIVAEMNRVGVMCDLSHVGSRTSEEVIL